MHNNESRHRLFQCNGLRPHAACRRAIHYSFVMQLRKKYYSKIFHKFTAFLVHNVTVIESAL